MDRWRNKIALVTGAGSGIGAAIVRSLVENGVQVVGCARRIELVQKLSNELNGKPGKLHAYKCDVQNNEEVTNMFKWTKETLGPVHIIVNNAAAMYHETTLEGNLDTLKSTINTNIWGPVICTKLAVAQMREAKIAGHIININSILGHNVVNFTPPCLNLYPATKFAITALSESLIQEIRHFKEKIKVTSVSPGLVHNTELFVKGEYTELCPDKVDEMSHLMPEDVANAVMFALGTPPHVQIYELTIKPLGEQY